MIRNVAVTFFFMVGLFGCGNAAPTVEDVKVSSRSITRGQEFFVTLLGVEDPDGDVFLGKVEVEVKPLNEQLDEKLKDTIDIMEPDHSGSKGDVLIGIRIFGRVPLDTYEVRLVYEDEAGEKADPKVIQVAVIN